MERQNTYELVLTSCTKDMSDYLITLYVNGLFICTLHNFNIVKRHLKETMERLHLKGI